MAKKPSQRGRPKGECTIPPPLNLSVMPDFKFGQHQHEERRVREYMKWQACDEKVVHLEKVGKESLMGRVMGLWSVETDQRKWWVITNPTNLYAQDLFPSLDYTISFHVGVTTRMMERDKSYEGNARVHRIMPTLKRLEAAGDEFDEADEPEAFQTVGMRLRECLLSLVHALGKPEYVPTGQEASKRSDFVHWTEAIAGAVARGSSLQETRAYLKTTAKTTWQLVNWLTHTTNAVRQDVSLAIGAVHAVVSSFLQAVEKHESGAPDKCPACGSYRVVEDFRPDLGIDPPYVILCERCDWITPKKVRPAAAKAANAAQALAESARSNGHDRGLRPRTKRKTTTRARRVQPPDHRPPR